MAQAAFACPILSFEDTISPTTRLEYLEQHLKAQHFELDNE